MYAYICFAVFIVVSIASQIPFDNGCNNAQDLAVFKKDWDNFTQTIQGCGTDCYFSESYCESCLGGVGFTKECADCFYADIQCSVKNCDSCYLEPTSPSCLNCTAVNCTPALLVCGHITANQLPPAKPSLVYRKI
eukprot:TRINITY_DN10941_c0_g1_i2.p1 TRINITY_DN10941_c0_g1~~TRINITY_DN10941_c0_g1_i2.p1  ORF type:complete len:135 (-),score=19.39 TRINITY_DN10941_c0_g1_i2:124-528(-)